MSEAELHVPRLGRVVADPGFRLVAAMNPFDAVGTARISSAVYDRVCRLSVDYQSAPEEEAIVARGVPATDQRWLEKIVELVRRTRTHPDLRVGSSVRGALDASAVVSSLGSLRTTEEIVTELWSEVFGTAPAEDDGAAEGKAIAPTGASPG